MRKPHRIKLNVNDKVIVNKDIFRLEEQWECDIRLQGLEPPKPITLEEYHAVDWSKWRRQQKLYAKAGEEGVVIELFHDRDGRWWKKENPRRFAKVRIGDKIKTFRCTSLEKY